MSRRHEEARHLEQFQDLADIMGAMKNIALMQVNKLNRVLTTQQRVMATFERAVADFVAHYPPPAPPPETAPEPIILLGSERGFCGDFNEAVLRALREHVSQRPGGAEAPPPHLIAVGLRLHGKLGGDPRVLERVEGPSVLEEVDAALSVLVEALQRHVLAGRVTPEALTVLYHVYEEEGGAAGVRVFRPFEAFTARRPVRGTPPRLQMAPETFRRAVFDEYLFAALHAMFYSSLMAENRRRLQQMMGALQRLDQRLAEWHKRLNRLRQEEITEEIEEIMLSAEALRQARESPH